MHKLMALVSALLIAVTLSASEAWYDDLAGLRPTGDEQSNEFWNTSGRGQQTYYVYDSSGDTIDVLAWSASSAVVTTVDHPATFCPRWYSEGESSASSAVIQPPPMLILIR